MSRFSDFIRNGSEEEKAEVFNRVLDKATQEQNALLSTESKPVSASEAGDLVEELIAFSDFLNSPTEYEEKYKVREYRHEAYERFEKMIGKIIAALSHRQSRPIIDQTDVPDMNIIIDEYNKGDIDMLGLVCRIWNKAYYVGTLDASKPVSAEVEEFIEEHQFNDVRPKYPDDPNFPHKVMLVSDVRTLLRELAGEWRIKKECPNCDNGSLSGGTITAPEPPYPCPLCEGSGFVYAVLNAGDKQEQQDENI